VAIINETLARQFFPGENPIGRTLVTGMAQMPSEVVGVVADVRGTNLNTPPAADYFLPALQRPDTFTNILIRSIPDPSTMTSAVRAALREIDPNLPLLQPQALMTRVDATVADRKLAMVLLGGFAGLALLLALLGVYSVMAHLVAHRTAEIGIRMALGASRASVLRMVLGHGRRLTLMGIALGIAGALGVTRLLQQALFEVDPAEPAVYAAISLLLLAVAEGACWLPARRATRIDPVTAMRTD
jgi:putative ABC transport system permease protein